MAKEIVLNTVLCIYVDDDGVGCGDCEFPDPTEHPDRYTCPLFSMNLEYEGSKVTKDHKLLRCDECIGAEKMSFTHTGKLEKLWEKIKCL